MLIYVNIFISTYQHKYIKGGIDLAGKMCPNCGKQTFYLSPGGRKCSYCNWEMSLPANEGKGGKGQKCANCGKFTVFNNKCTSCGATYHMNNK